MLFTLLAFVIALGILITFHEFGHYWVARRCGVHVERFSIGFGKVLLRRRDRHGTEWALSAIPLGGYVKFLDDGVTTGQAPQTANSTAAFNAQPLRNRAAIVAAGPVANLLLAVVLYAALAFLGTMQPAPVVGQPPVGSPAAAAGFAAGDRIVTINEQPVVSWNDVRWQLMDSVASGGEVPIGVKTGQGVQRSYWLRLPGSTVDPEGADPLEAVGLSLRAPRPVVRELVPGGAGEQAGLKTGDVIVSIGALVDPTATELVAEVKKSPGLTLPLVVQREGSRFKVDIVPHAEADADGQPIGRIGVMLGGDLEMVEVQYGPLESLWKGFERTVDTVVLSLKMMGRMLVGDISLRNVSGPVTIADYAGQTARVGMAAYISFLALISVSIGILNLLPVPMLDGGHLLYYAMEAVRGRPLPESWLVTGQRIGLGLLAALMSLAFFNDLTRLFS
jgi:RIP metalloprotease RseP